MRDRGNRGFGQRRAGPDFDQHAGFRRLLRFAEDGFFRERNVDARLFHFGNRHDGAFELSFDGAPIVDVLGEIGHAEIGFVENLEADSSALGHTGGGQFQAQLSHFVFRHRNGGSVVGQAVFRAALFQFLNYHRRVFRRERGVQAGGNCFPSPNGPGCKGQPEIKTAATRMVQRCEVDSDAKSRLSCSMNGFDQVRTYIGIFMIS